MRAFCDDDAEAVVGLWQACGLTRPWNDPAADIERKLADSPELPLVGVIDGRVVASVMVGYDGHRGWMDYLAVDPDRQRHGLCRRMVEAGEERLAVLGCAEVNLQICDDNADAQGFYAVGYDRDTVVGYGKRLVRDG